jgi:hypothetical protein
MFIKQVNYIPGGKGKAETAGDAEMVDQELQQERELQMKLARYI